ncbi:MAG: type IX secretion system membrane protein PorP/SprF [bacterium]
MNKNSKSLDILLFVSASIFATSGLRAQNIINANPAESYDFRAAFVNPAIISFQNAHVAAGGKLFHLGFVDNQSNPFRQGYVSLSLPFGINNQTGFGIQAQYFNTPLFSQSNISLNIAKRIHRIYSFGLKLNVFSKSFNRDNFDLVDPDDPVFANGTSVWSTTLGAGVAVIPHPNLSLGIGVDHINRANVSLIGDDVTQPIKAYFGAFLDLSVFQASVSFIYEDGRFLPKTSVGSSVSKLGFFRLGYNNRSAEFEGQLHLTGPLSLNYSYDYTLFDNQGNGQGSHQFTLIHDFDAKRELPDFEIPQELILNFEPPKKAIDIESRFYVYPTIEKLEIMEKKLTRVVNPNVSKEALAQLSPLDVGVLDSSETESYLPFKKDTVDTSLLPAVLEANMSKEYKNFVKGFADKLNERHDVKANIIAPKQSILRAAALKKHLQPDSSQGAKKVPIVQPVFYSTQDSLLASEKLGPHSLRSRETLTTLSQTHTTFKIMPVFLQRTIASWSLIIENKGGQEIKRFDGTGMPPGELAWDWKDAAGKLVEPGVYYYYLACKDHSDNSYVLEKKPIYIQKILRNIKIEITNQPKKIGADVDEIDLILKK